MITLHHLNNSRSQRVLWMMEELSIPYEIKYYQRDKKTMLAPEELKKVHPLGKSPVITDGDVTIAETGAIIEYLTNKYKTDFRPAANTPEFLQYTYWLHFSEGSMMPPLLIKLIFDKVKSSPMPFFVKPIAKQISNKVMKAYAGPNIKNNLDFVNAHLGNNIWFSGEQFTGADIIMSYPLEAAISRAGAANYPNIARFTDVIHARPAYQKAIATGGPYDFA